MKRHVFLFLSIFSFFSVHAMNKNAIDNTTNAQIADALSAYCSVYSDLVNTKHAEAFIKHIRTNALTFEDKTDILEQMKNFPQPHNVCIIGDKKAVLFERDSNESKSKVY